MHTVGDIAALEPGVSHDQLSRTLRELIAKEVVTPTDRAGSGVTAAAVFDDLDLCRVVIILYLNRLGLKMEALKVAYHDHMNSINGYQDDGIGPRRRLPDRLRKVREAIIDGNPYYYHLYLVPDYFGRPGDVLGGAFSPTSAASPDLFSAVVTVPLLPLLQPLIRATAALKA